MLGRHMNAKTPIWILYGVGILFGSFALLALFTGSWGAFVALSVFSLGFAGFGWAFRRLSLPREGEDRGSTIGLLAMVMFGGAGLAMAIGSFFLLANGELGGLGLTIFGLIFCGVGYLARKIFSTPKGMKDVLVNQTEQTVSSKYGGVRTVTQQEYALVDESMSDAEIKAKQQEWAEKPWTQREDWAAGAVEQADQLNLRLLIGFTIVWNVISAAITGAVLANAWNEGPSGIALLLFVFPAFGIMLVVLAIRTWLRRRRFGRSVLRFHAVPAWLGERLRGAVETNIPTTHQSRQGFRVRIACLREKTYHDRRGGDRSEVELLWEREEQASVPDDGAPLVRIPIDVALPADQPPTEMPPKDQRMLWRLVVSQKLPGIDYRAVFDVPVFRKEPSLVTAEEARKAGRAEF
jgi:hypothetical protein